MEAYMQDEQVILKVDKTKKLSIITYILVTVFGTGSWVAMNGIWVELPNLVNVLPEGWTLPSYLTVICQLANVGPVVYSLLQKYMYNKAKLLRVVVYMSVTLGIFACILLTLTWRNTMLIKNKEISVALLGSTFLLAIVDCTSSVTFLPYMAILPNIYMSPFYVGETLSGLLPGLLALAQGIEDNSWNKTGNGTTSGKYARSGLLFPQEMFFALLGILMLACLCAFICLNNSSKVKQISLSNADLDADHIASRVERDDDDQTMPFYSSIISEYDNRKGVIILLCILVLLNAFQNGVTSSISSYTYAPFGSLTYHLAATLGAISSALACFLYLWFPCKSMKVIYIDTVAYAAFVTYIVILATQAPNPWLKGTVIGKIVMVIVSIVSGGLVSFTKLAIVSVMKDCGQKYLFWAGVSNQVGSFLGAVVMFPLVNFTTIFSAY